MGRELSGFHVLLTRLYIEAELATTAFCMLPPLLAWSGVPLPAVWRASSATIVTAMLLNGWAYPRRRRVKTLDRLPLRRWLAIAIGSIAVTLGLLANIAGFPYRAWGRPHCHRRDLDTWVRGCDFYLGPRCILGTAVRSQVGSVTTDKAAVADGH